MAPDSILSDLIDAEREAASLVAAAHAEASKRIASASMAQEAAKREALSTFDASSRQRLADRRETIAREFESALKAYEAELDAMSLNRNAFEALMDKLLGQAL